MSLDIPCEKFYSWTPNRLLRYLPYYVERKKVKRRDEDELAWLHGIYTLRGISTIGKGHYPDKPLDPYGINQHDVTDNEDEAEKMTDADAFGAWAMAFNKEKFGVVTKESEVSDDG